MDSIDKFILAIFVRFCDGLNKSLDFVSSILSNKKDT